MGLENRLDQLAQLGVTGAGLFQIIAALLWWHSQQGIDNGTFPIRGQAHWNAFFRFCVCIGTLSAAKDPSPRPSPLLKGRGRTFRSLVANLRSWGAPIRDCA